MVSPSLQRLEYYTSGIETCVGLHSSDVLFLNKNRAWYFCDESGSNNALI